MIDTVSSITYDLDGVTRVLHLEHDGEVPKGRLDGAELSADNVSRLYSATLSLTHDGGTETDIPPDGPAYRFSMELTDGGSDTMELYSINDTQYLIVRNGENQRLFITRMTLRHILLSCFETLDRGEDLPARY